MKKNGNDLKIFKLNKKFHTSWSHSWILIIIIYVGHHSIIVLNINLINWVVWIVKIIGIVEIINVIGVLISYCHGARNALTVSSRAQRSLFQRKSFQ